MKLIDDYLKFQTNKGTIKQYKQYIEEYFETINIKPSISYFNTHRNHENDLYKYYTAIKDNSPYTLRNKIGVITRFLKRYKTNIDEAIFEQLKNQTKRARKITIDEIPTKSQIKQILSFLNLREQTIVLIGISTGMRIGEILSLKTTDLDFNTELTKIKIRAETTKSKYARIVFLTPEATEKLKQWLQYREQHIENANEKIKRISYKLQKENTNNIFVTSKPSFNYHYTKALAKAKLNERNEKTGIHTYHFHVYRQFFKTNSRINPQYLNRFIGHTNELDDKYFKPTTEMLIEEYKKSIPNLSVYETTQDLTELENTIEELSQRIEKLEIDKIKLKLAKNYLENHIEKRGDSH